MISPSKKKTIFANIPIKNLAFLLSRKCNLKCKHCCNYSSVLQMEKLGLESIISKIHEAAMLGVKQIVITGGEPFLFFNEIDTIIKETSNMNLLAAVITNASWAFTLKSCLERLVPLKEAGLNLLVVSYDYFHQQAGVKVEFVNNVIEACSKLSIQTSISETVHKIWGEMEYERIRL